jgi:hypothetical protein
LSSQSKDVIISKTKPVTVEIPGSCGRLWETRRIRAPWLNESKEKDKEKEYK